MIFIGTSGFSYDDWKGRFYPPDIKANEMLPFYAKHFSALELNYTYYRMPDAHALDRMVHKTGGRVTFTVKAHQDITHTRPPGSRLFAGFREALSPLTESSTLGCVLAQFPWSFYFGAPGCEYLKRLSDGFRGIPVVIEFRNSRWIREEVFDFLKKEELGFCCVDQPRLKGLMPPLAVATSSTGYFRFHGRNAGLWWKHEQPHQRYDYLYTEEELIEWVPKIKKIAAVTERTFVFTNNHYEAKAIKNARMLADLLEAPNAPGLLSGTV